MSDRRGAGLVKRSDFFKGMWLSPLALTRGPKALPDNSSMIDAQRDAALAEVLAATGDVLKVKSFEKGMEILNGNSYGLSGSLYTRDIRRAMAAIRDMETGIIYVNAPTIGAEVHLPFGGVKHTGNGHREAGTAALDIFSEWKTVYIDYSGKLQKAQMDE